MPGRFTRLLVINTALGTGDVPLGACSAPYPDVRHKGGVRRFPSLVPDRPDAEGAALSRRARHCLRTQWSGQTFMAVGMKDPVLGPPAMALLRAWIRNCPAPWATTSPTAPSQSCANRG
jgi:haloalkane dehalogenase/tRNA(adenine34) deaminase